MARLGLDEDCDLRRSFRVMQSNSSVYLNVDKSMSFGDDVAVQNSDISQTEHDNVGCDAEMRWLGQSGR